MDAITMHRARLLPHTEDEAVTGCNSTANATDRRALPATRTLQGSQLERLAARFNAFQARGDGAESASADDKDNATGAAPAPAPAPTPTPTPTTLPAPAPAPTPRNVNIAGLAGTLTVPRMPGATAAEANREATANTDDACREDTSKEKNEATNADDENPETHLPAEKHSSATPHASSTTRDSARDATLNASPSPALMSETAVAAMANAFALTRTAAPLAETASGTVVADAPPFIDGIVSRLADFCADPAVFERGAWHVTVPLQNVLSDCVLHVALSHFDLTLRFETSSDSVKNVLLQHASTLRDRLTALLKAKQTTPRGIEIIVT